MLHESGATILHAQNTGSGSSGSLSMADGTELENQFADIYVDVHVGLRAFLYTVAVLVPAAAVSTCVAIACATSDGL